MDMNSILIAEELKSLRIRNNKTIEEVSHDLGIHFNTLSKYEKDAKNMQLGTLNSILKYYGINEFIFFKMICDYNHNVQNKVGK